MRTSFSVSKSSRSECSATLANGRRFFPFPRGWFFALLLADAKGNSSTQIAAAKLRRMTDGRFME
ncbi:unnamed protein product [Soboliphyme baturini]|uniref:Serine hydrolase n=1 Tax=Soboliphyme baturini TaxID=241478 RepID=A0A183J541_9BILA|nr:unnamed protein product [Soboliphyme baturini]